MRFIDLEIPLPHDFPHHDLVQDAITRVSQSPLFWAYKKGMIGGEVILSALKAEAWDALGHAFDPEIFDAFSDAIQFFTRGSRDVVDLVMGNLGLGILPNSVPEDTIKGASLILNRVLTHGFDPENLTR